MRRYRRRFVTHSLHTYHELADRRTASEHKEVFPQRTGGAADGPEKTVQPKWDTPVVCRLRACMVHQMWSVR